MEIEKLIAAIKLCGSTPRADQCKQCAYWNGGDMGKCIPYMTEDAATALEQLQAENDRFKRERDAAVEEIPKVCYYCKHRKGWKTCDRFNGNSEAETCSNWKWRGIKED